ncbi:MAG: hypothetical protein J5643_00490 [Lachnospiraceae bacterium]|nr:hypothetical protein [Lachnospiraceae bacterium]
MERYVYKTIEDFVIGKRQPVILYGTPGIGKTVLLRQLQESGKVKSHILIPLAVDREFTDGLITALQKGRSLCDYLQEFFGFTNETVSERLLVLLDGLEPLGKTVNELFSRDLPAYFAVTTSRIDYFDIFRNEKESVCKFIKVSGFSFYEFLDAVTKDEDIQYTDLLRAHFQSGKPVPDLIDEELRELFHDYLLTGGYPEAILQYRKNRTDLAEIRRVHGMLYASSLMRYLNNLPEGRSPVKTLQLLNYVRDYAYDSRGQFHPGHIRRGAQAREFSKEIEYLTDNGVLIPVYKDGQFYRFEIADFGLLHYLANDYDVFYKLDNNENLPEYLYQNYLYHELSARELTISIVKEGRSGYLSYTNGTAGLQHSARERKASKAASDTSFKTGMPANIRHLSDRKISPANRDHNIQYYFLEQTQF